MIMYTQTIRLSGLTCSACKKLIEKRIGLLPGVTKVDVTVSSGEATVVSDKEMANSPIQEALKDTPYRVIA